ncbi:hypothetical protein JMJ35_003909 [Cladonia borealis]|uniref:O-methyltransferase C-terminal domain-containing protein n=1 Tax=Cladonia borealis TaxID=184061 RepID=A0AA39R490_9LECA|nr:hypothetical protein JMJ35_003909 [Cladonia borealis]
MTPLPNPYDVPALLKEIEANGMKLSEGGGQVRQQCLAAAQALCYALETPMESIIRTHWAEQAHHAALCTENDLHLFDKWEEAGSGIKASSELSELTGSDPSLLARILKHLAAMGTIYETGPDQYCPTPVSKALSMQVHRDGFPTSFDLAGPPVRKLHEYLAMTGYQNPQNTSIGPYQYGHQTPDDFWTMISKRPEMSVAVDNSLAGRKSHRLTWMDHGFYPVEDNLAGGVSGEEEAVLLVDVGGGTGTNLQEFHGKYPGLHGQLILQDKPEVIKQATGLDQSIRTMAHDFFTEQPVKGARAYYMSSVLHDWTDEQCAEILANLKFAMTPMYSKLLIHEFVIPDTGAHWISTALDIMMMAVFSSRERREQDWRKILEGVGFRIIKIWTAEPGAESLIEAELATEIPEHTTHTLTEADGASEAPDGIAQSGTEELVERRDVIAVESGMASIINADPSSHAPAIEASEPESESSPKTILLSGRPRLVVS